MRGPSRVLVVVVVGVLVLLWASDAIVELRFARQLGLSDGLSYQTAARHLIDGQPLYSKVELAGPYSLTDMSSGRGFVYPPTGAVLLAPLALGVPVVSLLFGFGWVMLGWLVFAVARREGVARPFAGLVAAAVTCSGPALNALLSANANLLVADGVLLTWLAPRVSGWVAVLGGMTKLYPAGLVVWTLRRREPLLGPVLLCLAVFAGTVVSLGPQPWLDYAAVIGNAVSDGRYAIPSPIHVLAPLGLVRIPVVVVATALLCVAVLRVHDDHVAFVVLGWALIFPAPDWWPHYLLVAIVAAVPLACRYAVARWPRTTEAPRAAAPLRASLGRS